MSWCVYILECADSTLYTGATSDIARRVRKHNEGRGAKYTRSRRPVALRWISECNSKQAALRLEVITKQLSRIEKIRLIEGGLMPAAKTPISKFYITKWPLECGIIVAEGSVTGARAIVADKDIKYTEGLKYFDKSGFFTTLAGAKGFVSHSIGSEIDKLKRRLKSLEELAIRVGELEEDAPLWTNTIRG